MNRTGFTYRGRHSSEFGIVCDPESRQLLPARRRTRIDVPGRHGSYVFSGALEERTESFRIAFLPGTMTTPERSREIAAWLSQDGELRFDTEPDKVYMAYFSSAPSGLYHRLWGEITLQFTYNPPFALSDVKQTALQTGSNTLQYKGTAEAPARISITNVGTADITNIQIAIRRRK